MSAELNCVQGILELVDLINGKNGKTVFKEMDILLIPNNEHNIISNGGMLSTRTQSPIQKKKTTLNIEELVLFLGSGWGTYSSGESW